MTSTRADWAQDYADALTAHLAGAAEATLQRAWELGRTAMAEGQDLLALVSLHHEALRKWLDLQTPDAPAAATGMDRQVFRAAQDFLAEALAPFEMAHRQFQEAVTALRNLNQMLEEEARRIARSLHDDAGQLLVSVYLALDEVTQGDPEFRRRLEGVRLLLDEVEKHMRRLSHELRPLILDGLGLVPALEFLAQGVARRAGLVVEVRGPDDVRLPPPVELALYRVVQEALNNAVRHAHAQHVGVVVTCEAARVQCEVHDDGVGFDPGAAADARRGMGLVNMRERISALAGRLDIDSEPGTGTRVVIEVPLEVGDAVSSPTCR